MSGADPSENPETPELELPADVLFDLLSDPHRRDALRYLLDRPDDVTIEDLSAKIATDEDQPDERRLSIRLHHAHLPKLSAAGLVRYDPDAATVEALSSATDLESLLDEITTLEE